MSSDPQQLSNQFLAALPAADYGRLAPYLEPVTLSRGDVIYALGQPIDYVYFPLGVLISLVSPVGQSATEFGLIGNEGLVGVAALLGGSSTISCAVVRVASSALRIEASVLKVEFERGEALQKLALLYVQWLLTQTIQNAACQAHHSTESRLARWLLSIQDRLHQPELQLTQKYIASLLGTRRATITAAAGKLQESAAIRYSRGAITILDRTGLERQACECYALLHQEYARLKAISQTSV